MLQMLCPRGDVVSLSNLKMVIYFPTTGICDRGFDDEVVDPASPPCIPIFPIPPGVIMSLPIPIFPEVVVSHAVGEPETAATKTRTKAKKKWTFIFDVDVGR